jgi:hypothetical protein
MNKYNAVIITIVQEVIQLNLWKMGHRTVVVVYKDDIKKDRVSRFFFVNRPTYVHLCPLQNKIMKMTSYLLYDVKTD